MVATALTAFLTSSLVLGFFLAVTAQERRRGRRFFAASVRAWLDNLIDTIGRKCTESVDHFIRYVVQLNWYYSIHGVLRALLRGLVAIYSYFEDLFERNRQRTKELRRERQELSALNHLRQMAEHKEETALTPAQQRKLRKRVLEGKE